MPYTALPCSDWANAAGAGDNIGSTPYFLLVRKAALSAVLLIAARFVQRQRLLLCPERQWREATGHAATRPAAPIGSERAPPSVPPQNPPRIDYYSANTDISLRVTVHDWLGANCTGDGSVQPPVLVRADSLDVSGGTTLPAVNGTADFGALRLRAREGLHNVTLTGRLYEPSRELLTDMVREEAGGGRGRPWVCMWARIREGFGAAPLAKLVPLCRTYSSTPGLVHRCKSTFGRAQSTSSWLPARWTPAFPARLAATTSTCRRWVGQHETDARGQILGVEVRQGGR